MPDPDEMWIVTPTDRGTGLTCPHDDCGCKMLLNPDRFKDCVGKRANSRTCICPSCERRSTLPQEAW